MDTWTHMFSPKFCNAAEYTCQKWNQDILPGIISKREAHMSPSSVLYPLIGKMDSSSVRGGY